MVFISVLFILMAKFGMHRDEITFHRLDVQLLGFLLVYRVTSTCYCRGAIIFSQNLASDGGTTNIDDDQPAIPASPDVSELLSVQTSLSSTVTAAEAAESGRGSQSLYIARNNLGDTFFDADHTWLSCSMEKCRRKSSGTASVAIDLHNIGDERKLFFDRYTPNDKLCHCRCHQNTPTFREDLHVCVNDIHECLLVSFVSGNTQQKIPYVLLPLRGQIIYPTAEIKFHGIRTVPTCIVSRVRYLSESGWGDIKNYSSEHSVENPLPFRLFHDKQRTFLQWLGNNELRMSMEGRLLLIDLICKDAISQLIFTPCISFRIAGAPSSNSLYFDDLPDHNSNFEKERKFSAHEYLALGFATFLIALIYIASVFLYLHFKKSKLKEKSLRRNKAFTQFIDMDDNTLFGDSSGSSGPPSKQLVVEQEGLVKNNPLLLKRYHTPTTTSCHKTLLTSPEDTRKFTSDQVEMYKTTDAVRPHPPPEPTRITNILTHNAQPMDISEPRWSVFRNRLPRTVDISIDSKQRDYSSTSQKLIIGGGDSNNREEKHPDEDISIVECPEDVVPANSKHKLYFNPAYLEPELLLTPPPAAVEFLFKIREIVSLARRKISSKKFLPSLTQIPEETRSHESTSTGRRSSSHPPTPNPPYLVKEDKEKRQIIQKWLQTIPTLNTECSSPVVTEKLSTFAADQTTAAANQTPPAVKEQTATVVQEEVNDNFAIIQKISPGNTPVKPKRNSLKSNHNSASSRASSQATPTEMSYDSLERKSVNRKHSDRTTLVDGTSGDARTMSSNNNNNNNNSNNNNLPMDEELTMQNAVFNIVTGSTTMSKLKIRKEQPPVLQQPQLVQEIAAAENKYSLVSEVYVNDNFSGSSDDSCSSQSEDEFKAPTANSDSKPSNSGPTRSTAPNKFQESSRLMIQLNDCPFFYSMEPADDFEPDTLDRHLIKENIDEPQPSGANNNHNLFIDSLERPPICLRSHGSFRDHLYLSTQPRPANLKRSFSSLQEIYQQRRKSIRENERSSSDGPQSLTPHIESLIWKREGMLPRHHYRQRKPSFTPPIPDSIILSRPPPPPLPNRECAVETTINRLRGGHLSGLVAPNCRTHKDNGNNNNDNDNDNDNNCSMLNSQLFANRAFRFSFTKGWAYRPDDSGYLSSSSGSEKSQIRSQSNTLEKQNAACVVKRPLTNDEDDEDDDESSCGTNDDENSESGAESTATNFKFYKNRVKLLGEFDGVGPVQKVQSVTGSFVI